jgi:hypothetical protein
MVRLQNRYREEIEDKTDLVDLYQTFLGHMAHKIMETTLQDSVCTGEQRYVLDTGMGVVSGTPDHYNPATQTIQDYKYTSVFSYMSQGSIVKWTEQLNLYAYILGKNGLNVNGLEIVCILRDWQPNKVGREAGYPETWCHVVPISLWSLPEQALFLLKRLNEHRNPDNPQCTPGEMWEKPSTWAVMKKGQKRAVRVFKEDDEDGMDQAATTYNINGTAYWWEKRPGERTRCERWCNVRDWCPQYAEYIKSREV